MTLHDCAPIGKVRKPVTERSDGPVPSRSASPKPPIGTHPPIGKVTGSRHLAAALCYSLGGAARLLGETAFRHELLAAVGIFAAFAFVGAGLSDYVSMAVLFLALIATEALNTAIEEIIDRISPEWSQTGRHAKDLGSFAVFCLLAANGLMAAFVIGSKLLSP
ncbi:diacylglycerol kinase [Rhizobiales bacterium RZME27]|jgi:diacylglycerol kinase (ATP)|uniref:Diacylglycerol kinase n=1 Tax=Endobacterium cereale TaxID=2663029 RepID=A0A6A8A6R1_9HYPH|nr:diacylglycerol kinase [Endobacterium cereale]MEB2847820.1 diacylglycerol kinase [Endobacterium cereale]MQY46843.1 diacylglycerol kinase [Endobacterium cereale]